MKQLGLMIDLNRCFGCKTCIIACRNHNKIVDHENCLPNEIPYYIRVQSKRTGAYPCVSEQSWVVPCQHCPDPGCLAACPQGAISKDPRTGIVNIDRGKCTGCEYKADIGVKDKIKPAPCQVSCPAGLNVQGYVQMVKQGNYEGAVNLILKKVPLPGVLGRICPHPCEDYCSRKEVDEAISIRELKRVAADNVDFEKMAIPKIRENGHKIAVIGSGPAGLTVAFYLRLKGYQVVIFEALDVLGGMLRVGIPDYRLPMEVLDREIGYLLRHGIATRTGVNFGMDVTFQDLKREGFDAVLLAIGLQGGMALNIPGCDAEGVIDAVSWLRELNLGAKNKPGKNAVILGGGNVAIDAARAAKRLGCEKVTVAYRRGREEMPASSEEIASASQEGIAFQYLVAPVKVVQKDGKVVGLECVRNELALPDESGRPRPVPITGSEFVMECDTVIPAIGQRLKAKWLQQLPELAITGEGTCYVSKMMQTTIPHVFAAGDAVRGAATVIHAIADGHRAVEGIHRYVQGLPVEPEYREWKPADQSVFTREAIPSGVFPEAARAAAKQLDPVKRATSFLEESEGLSKEQAQAEGERCLNCGCSCMNSCDYGVIQFNTQTGTSHKCNLCADITAFGDIPVCAEVCMSDAISFGEVEILKMKALNKGRTIIEELSRESHIYVK
jgi:heterodisulfide reductase subunit A